MSKTVLFRKSAPWVGLLLFLGAILLIVPSLRAAPTLAPSQPYTWNNVQIVGGGFVPGIIFNETEPGLVYARTDIGGAYRLDKTTERWIPMTDWIGWDDWGYTGIVSLATDPVEPNRVYLAAGTYTNDWANGNGAILRSSNYGESWQISQLPFKLGGNMPGRSMGERLAIDPNDNSILYLAAPSGNGLWKSTNYGATWSKVASFPNPGDFVVEPGDPYLGDNQGVLWVTFDPTTGSSGSATQTIYVGVADLSESVYRSTDGGATWAAVAGQPTGFLPHHGILGSNGVLVISYSDGPGPYDGESGDVWKLDTADDTWTNISPVPSSSGDNYFGYGGLAVDPQDPDTIVVATLNSWWPDANLYRSTDGGATWSPIWEWTSYPTREFRYTMDISDSPWLAWGGNPTPPEVSPKLGWMIGDLDIDPFDSDRMMYGTGATIYGSKNLTNWDADSAVTIEVMADGLEETAIQDLISPPEGPELISGMYDVYGFVHDDVSQVPDSFFQGPLVPGEDLDYAELSPNFLVRVGEGESNNIAFSYDMGGNWFVGSTEPSGASGGGSVAASAEASSVVWSAPGATSVAVSTNNGSSWSNSTGIPAGAFVASDRVNDDVFYGLSAGTFYVSTDGGASFSTTAASGLPTTNYQMKAVPGNEGDIWVAGGDTDGAYGLWHSTNGGASFTKLANVEEADNIGFGKAAPGHSYFALYTSAKIDGVRGIFRSDDGGASWVRINDDEHQWGWTGRTITGDLRTYGRVYVGTNGRGIFYGDPAGTVATPTPCPGGCPTSTPVPPTATSAPPTATPVGPTATATSVPPTATTAPPTATSAPPTATPILSGSCVVAYDVVNDWGGGFQANVTITNNSSSAVDGYTLTWNHAPGQTVTSSWNVTMSQTGSLVEASNPAGTWNGVIGANGGSVTFGFQGVYSGSVVVPTDFVLNTTACNGGEEPTATPVPPTATTAPPTATTAPPTATSVPPTATTAPPTATSVPPTATTVPPTATTAPPTATSVPPTATSVPPTATPVVGASCTVAYDIVNQWGDGFQVNLTIANGGTSAVSGYTLEWDFLSGEQMGSGWNATFGQSGTTASASNPASQWNGTIQPGGSVSFGFVGTHSGTVSIPASFSLNGSSCAIE